MRERPRLEFAGKHDGRTTNRMGCAYSKGALKGHAMALLTRGLTAESGAAFHLARYRPHAHADPCRAGRGRQGPTQDASTPAARAAQGMMAALPVRGMAVADSRSSFEICTV